MGILDSVIGMSGDKTSDATGSECRPAAAAHTHLIDRLTPDSKVPESGIGNTDIVGACRDPAAVQSLVMRGRHAMPFV